MNSLHKILRMPAVIARTGRSRSAIYKAVKDGDMPPSISLGARSVGWLEADIEAWLDGRIHLSRGIRNGEGDDDDS